MFFCIHGRRFGSEKTPLSKNCTVPKDVFRHLKNHSIIMLWRVYVIKSICVKRALLKQLFRIYYGVKGECKLFWFLYHQHLVNLNIHSPKIVHNIFPIILAKNQILDTPHLPKSRGGTPDLAKL